MRYQAAITGIMFLFLAQMGFSADEALIRIMVKYRESTGQAFLKTQLSQAVELPLETIKPIAGGAYVLAFDNRNSKLRDTSEVTEHILERLRQNPNVVYALKDRLGHFEPTPQLTLAEEGSILLSHALQWNEFSPPGGVLLESAAELRDGAWIYSTGKATQPIVIAVLDTGIAPNPNLMNNFIRDEEGKILGWNFSANNRDLFDETYSYHGTHVAGIIAAYGDVVHGMGEDLKILPLKIPGANGLFYESQVINAIYWAVGAEVPGIPSNPYPAKVLNMSFGVDERPGKEQDHCDLALQEALDFVRAKGAVITAAAGNKNRLEQYSAPAVCKNTIKVAATGPAGLRAYYSNYGPNVHFAAPGGDLYYGLQGGILSTVNSEGGYQHSGFDFYQGTSMAAPHAAGIAGLIYAVKDGLISPEKVEKILRATTHAFGQSRDTNKSCVGKKSCGTGILDANSAVKAAIADYDEIFSLPLLTLKNCGEELFQSEIDYSFTSKIQWQLVKKLCQQKENYSQPELRQTKEGEIVVRWGEVTYRLDKSKLAYCQIIGVQGIGCYY